jgi:ComF family protein
MFEAGSKLVNRAGEAPATIGQNLITAAARVGRRLEAAALRLAVPGVCGLCGGPGQWDRCRAGLDLCVHCEAALPLAPATAGDPFTPFGYAPPVDFMIQRLKFGGNRGYARTLGILLGEARARLPGRLPDAIVPVPLHLPRLRERGFNQALELARVAGRVLGIRVVAGALRRVRPTRAQSGLGAAERADNVRGCFVLDPSALRRVRGRRIAILDDVFTTGSTCLEAARTLSKGGIDEIETWAVARAGGPAPAPPE